jgi:hypothetical protein
MQIDFFISIYLLSRTCRAVRVPTERSAHSED